MAQSLLCMYVYCCSTSARPRVTHQLTSATFNFNVRAIRASEVSKPNTVVEATRRWRIQKTGGGKSGMHPAGGEAKQKNGRMLSTAGLVGGLRAPLGARRVVDILTQGLFQISRALRTIQEIVAGSCTRIRRCCNFGFCPLRAEFQLW